MRTIIGGWHDWSIKLEGGYDGGSACHNRIVGEAIDKPASGNASLIGCGSRHLMFDSIKIIIIIIEHLQALL